MACWQSFETELDLSRVLCEKVNAVIVLTVQAKMRIYRGSFFAVSLRTELLTLSTATTAGSRIR